MVATTEPPVRTSVMSACAPEKPTIMAADVKGFGEAGAKGVGEGGATLGRGVRVAAA
jgi:hypothetical protein